MTTEQPTILKQIVADKRQWIATKQAQLPLANFQSQLIQSDRDFYQALQTNSQRPAYILECKKASPSKGVIREDFSPSAIAKVYQYYANVISVLTDEQYFQGDFNYIKEVRDIAPQPILCKDFIVSDYQIYLARHHHADAILLMLSILNDDEYLSLAKTAHNLGMGVLTETATAEEVERAITLQAQVIGINNRNLHDLSVDIHRTFELAKPIPSDRIIISESGIQNNQHIQQIQTHANAFLIGSSLMAEDDLNSAVRRIVYGEHKVCGLTREQDVQSAYDCGAQFGGLIFVEKSKRAVDLIQAKNLIKMAPLNFVGVFQNHSVEQVSKIANELNLFAVQLHGEENQDYINELRTQLASNIHIWQVVSIDINQTDFSNITFEKVDRYVLDSQVGSQQGGTGQVFDWSIISDELKSKSMLAGGLNIDNIKQAQQQGFVGLDINSGAESDVGIKDEYKLIQIFNQLLHINERYKLINTN